MIHSILIYYTPKPSSLKNFFLFSFIIFFIISITLSDCQLFKNITVEYRYHYPLMNRVALPLYKTLPWGLDLLPLWLPSVSVSSVLLQFSCPPNNFTCRKRFQSIYRFFSFEALFYQPIRIKVRSWSVTAARTMYMKNLHKVHYFASWEPNKLKVAPAKLIDWEKETKKKKE